MKKYLLNTNSKRIHLADSKDGRCKLNLMRDEYKLYFDDLQTAQNYPTPEQPLATGCCAFCIPKTKKEN